MRLTGEAEPRLTSGGIAVAAQGSTHFRTKPVLGHVVLSILRRPEGDVVSRIVALRLGIAYYGGEVCRIPESTGRDILVRNMIDDEVVSG